MTRAEVRLWKHVLRAGSLCGYSFRRQRPVLNYIADFMCFELKLIIEVDGITHTIEAVMRNDLIRQSALEEAGFTVLRFTDDEVLDDLDGVSKSLESWVKEFESVHPLPPASGCTN